MLSLHSRDFNFLKKNSTHFSFWSFPYFSPPDSLRLPPLSRHKSVLISPSTTIFQFIFLIIERDIVGVEKSNFAPDKRLLVVLRIIFFVGWRGVNSEFFRFALKMSYYACSVYVCLLYLLESFILGALGNAKRGDERQKYI